MCRCKDSIYDDSRVHLVTMSLDVGMHSENKIHSLNESVGSLLSQFV